MIILNGQLNSIMREPTIKSTAINAARYPQDTGMNFGKSKKAGV